MDIKTKCIYKENGKNICKIIENSFLVFLVKELSKKSD
jgi:hypothetical protein